MEATIADLESDRPIGFIRVIDLALEESHYWGDVPANLWAIDIWIREATGLGQGYGTQIGLPSDKRGLKSSLEWAESRTQSDC
jgi:hypothetical protein